MPLISVSFLVFTAVNLAVYYLIPGRWQRGWLLVSSYVFYSTYAWQLALTLLVLTIVNYALALRLGSGQRQRTALLWSGIAANVGALGFFKAVGFLLPDVAPALGVSAAPASGMQQLMLATGMSFYILQAISYLVDVYRGHLQAERRFVHFALYLAYFPKLLAGPIERARSFLPRLDRVRALDNAAITRSVTLILIGLVRKVVIADPLAAMIPSATFNAPLRGMRLLTWLVAYAFVLYNDFAGYTDLVRGVSGLFGIELSPNFAAPFLARSFTDFWNRWHITLSHWLRDYVYMPLSRALLRRKLSRYYLPNIVLPPVVAMLLCGLWHGPSANMLVWGALYGVYLVGERFVALWRPPTVIPRRNVVTQTLAIVGIFSLVVLALIPFRMDLPTAGEFIRALWVGRGWGWPDPRFVLLAIPALWLDWNQWRSSDELVFLRWTPVAQAALLSAALVAMFLVSQQARGVPFVYQGF